MMHPVTLRVRGERLDAGDAQRSCAWAGRWSQRTAPSPNRRHFQEFRVRVASSFFCHQALSRPVLSSSKCPPQRHSPQGKFAIPLGKITLGDDDANRWAGLPEGYDVGSIADAVVNRDFLPNLLQPYPPQSLSRHLTTVSLCVTGTSPTNIFRG